MIKENSTVKTLREMLELVEETKKLKSIQTSVRDLESTLKSLGDKRDSLLKEIKEANLTLSKLKEDISSSSETAKGLKESYVNEAREEGKKALKQVFVEADKKLASMSEKLEYQRKVHSREKEAHEAWLAEAKREKNSLDKETSELRKSLEALKRMFK